MIILHWMVMNFGETGGGLRQFLDLEALGSFTHDQISMKGTEPIELLLVLESQRQNMGIQQLILGINRRWYSPHCSANVSIRNHQTGVRKMINRVFRSIFGWNTPLFGSQKSGTVIPHEKLHFFIPGLSPLAAWSFAGPRAEDSAHFGHVGLSAGPWRPGVHATG